MNAVAAVTDADIAEILDEQVKRLPRAAADAGFEIGMVSPAQLNDLYPEHAQLFLAAPPTTHYACAKCDTRRGPLVCIIPIDGQVALRVDGLARFLVKMALARRMAEEDV